MKLKTMAGLSFCMAALSVFAADLPVPEYVGNQCGMKGLSADYIEPGNRLNPVRLMGKTVLLTAKRVELNPDTLLPRQAVIRTDRLFRDKPVLRVEAGKGGQLQVTKSYLKKNGKNGVIGEFAGHAGKVQVRGNLTIDFDGTMVYVLSLDPGKDACGISRVQLQFPLNLPDDRLVSAQVEGPNRPQSGLDAERRRLRLNLKDGETIRPGFCPFFWAGNTRCGFSVATENAHDWHTAPGNEFVFDSSTGMLTINIIEKETLLKKKVEWKFFFNITPLRKMPKNWRSWFLGTRYANFQKTDRTHLVYWQFWRANRTECHNNLWIHQPDLLKRIAAFDRQAGRGILHYFHPQLLSHTVVTRYKDRNVILEDPYLRSLCSRYHYLPQPSASRKIPDYSPSDTDRYLSVDLRDKALNGEMLNGKVYHASVAPVPEIQDHLVYSVHKMLQLGADGLYCDGAGPRENYRPGKDGGMPDFSGRIRPTYPIGNYRRVFRRIRAMIKENNPSAVMLAHNSGVAYAPILSLFDVRMTGENEFYWYKEEDLRDASPDGEFYYAYIWGDIDNLKADYSRAWGLPLVILPELKGRNHRPYAKITRGTRTMLSYTIQFDCLYWPLWCDAREIEKFEAVRNGFGMKEDASGIVDFVPYWENRQFRTSDQEVKIGYYERLQQIDPDYHRPEEKKYLLLVSNMQFSPVKTRITLPAVKFPLQAFDRQKNVPVAIQKNQIELAIEPYDFALVEVFGKADK